MSRRSRFVLSIVSELRKRFSVRLPCLTLLSLACTKAPPLPGLTCSVLVQM